MRMLVVTIAAAALACGRGPRSEADGTMPATGQPEPTRRATGSGTAAVREVRMTETPDGRFVFEPAALTLRVGDVVRWVNVGGGMHNVAFYADRIPAGAGQLLDATMPNRLTELTGPLLERAGQTYEVSFADMPPGVYGYYCTPHEMLGMKAQLTVVR
jgi:plastocyanin